MSIPRRSPHRQFGTFFVTSKTAQGRFLLQSERSAGLLIEVMLEQSRGGICQLHEFVVMPNHLHALITVQDSISRAVQQLKGRFAHDAMRKYRLTNIWQRGFSDHQIRDREDYDNHCEYIWQNPVRARLVQTPQDPFSSATGKFRSHPVPQSFAAAKAAEAGK